MPRARGFSSLLTKQRVQQYIADHQDKAEDAVTFGIRLDIEWEDYQAWSALNPSARRPSCDPRIQVKITQWLDQIDLRHVEPLDPDISVGPIIGTKGQEYKQDHQEHQSHCYAKSSSIPHSTIKKPVTIFV